MYYKFPLLLFICCWYSLVFAQGRLLYNPVIDVQHYQYSIEVNDLNDEIKATARLTILFRRTDNNFSVDLIGKNKQGKGMQVLFVKDEEANLMFSQQDNSLAIKMSRQAKAGEIKTFIIEYSGIPGNGLVFSKNKFKQRTIFSDNWPNRARNWLPCVDHLSDKASVEFLITAPVHYRVVSNGVLVEESILDANRKFTHWKETQALPTKVMAIGLADFAVQYAGEIECIPVSSWVFPQDKKNGFYDYAQALEILPWFIKQVGPYPYKKLANVEAITIFGGMENAAAIFYNEASINGKRTYSEELIAHEIAHQWFGNSATESDWAHVWLSEGFATEMTHLYLEDKYGVDTLKARLVKDRKAIVEFWKIRKTSIVDSSEKENLPVLLNRNSYEKGAWVLHMLRRKLGDTFFWKGVRKYYTEYAGKNASTNDLRKVFEEIAGTSLAVFFDQWLYTPGHPEITIQWQYEPGEKSLNIKIIQLQKPLFSFALDFNFKMGANKRDMVYTLPVEGRVVQVSIPMDIEPLEIVADPGVNLLFQHTITRVK